jgi:D-serine deaminase-like pyridoxal phosphate-dependent protein
VATPVAPPLPLNLDTPRPVIDLDIVERNASRMASAVAERGVSLRPHIKTHKSVALARMQLDAGAVGVTVGTLGEAEVMAAGGILDVFLAYPLWLDAPKTERLLALLGRDGLRLQVGVDSSAGAERLASALAGSPDGRRRLAVMIEIDPHYGRTGVAPHEAGELGAALERLGLHVAGAFTHGGHAYASLDAIAGAAGDEVQALSVAAQSLRAAGIEPQALSAGSSPTALHAATGEVTEVRPGTYLIGDRQQVALGASPADGVAIAIAATVVSEAVAGQVVINAGAKSLTKDVPAYLPGHGFLPAYPEGVLERVSDYHGQVRFPDGAERPRVGEVVAVVPNHACPVIDLYDTFAATRGGQLVGTWTVDARGRSG